MASNDPQAPVSPPVLPVLQEIRDLLHGYVPRGYLTLPQACQYLGHVPANTVREWIRTAGLPFYKPGKSLLFKLAELDHWMAKHKNKRVRRLARTGVK